MSKRKNLNSKDIRIKNFMKMQIINIAAYLTVFVVLVLISLGCDVGTDSMLYISIAFIGVSSFISGCIAGFRERRKGIICGIVNVLPLNILIFAFSLIFNSFKADISILITFLTGILTSATGGIVAVNIRLR